jgi:hypothetical protein
MKNLLIGFLVFFSGLCGHYAMAQNYALDLDAVNDKIGVSNSASLNPSTALTVEAWINADTWKSSVWAGTIVGKQATSPDRGYCLTAGEGGKAEFTVSINNVWVSATTAAVMGLNSWYHVAGVFDGTTISVYINGNLQASAPAAGVISTGTSTMYIGENPTWTGRLFDGTIDEVRIWNVARSASEIQSNFGTELTGSETGLVAYYKMNENTGTTVGDATTNANTGTMLNMDPATDWVPGFEVSASDVGVTGIAKPCLLGTGFTAAEPVSIEIKNFATTPVTGFQANYSINGGTVVSETVNATIMPFETYIYTFTNTVDLNGQSAVSIKAYTSFATDLNTANDTLSRSLSQSLSNTLFNNVQHNFGAYGQINHNIFYMPDSLTDYSQILLHVTLSCPTGGCDPWDQFARISLVKDGTSWELARYITPFGIACGGWTFDITDFRSLLSGKVDFESFIQVWGASGWLLNASIELVPGTPAYKYVQVQKLWDKDYLVYGDPAISYDLTDTLMYIPANTQNAKIRLTTTGHGQGNTSNAAEFYDATHSININGSQAFTQYLWRTDCGSNTCSGQSGTWTTSRAGWCPGQDVQPAFFDLSGLYTAGQTLSFDYVLQSYTNLLNTGYNNGSHTEPFLRIKGYLVTSSNTPMNGIESHSNEEAVVSLWPNPAHEMLNVYFTTEASGPCRIEIMNLIGSVCTTRLSASNGGSCHESISLHGLTPACYIVKITTPSNVMIRKIIVQ